MYDDSPHSIITDEDSAERSACTHMKWLGFPDAQVMPKGADDGIDVFSSTAIGQVKNYGNRGGVGRPQVRDLIGTCAVEGGKTGVFYSRAGYAAGTHSYATDSDVALFEYTETGQWKPSNEVAEHLVSERRARAASAVEMESSFSPSAAKGENPATRAEPYGTSGLHIVSGVCLVLAGVIVWIIGLENRDQFVAENLGSGEIVIPFYIDYLTALSVCLGLAGSLLVMTMPGSGSFVDLVSYVGVMGIGVTGLASLLFLFSITLPFLAAFATASALFCMCLAWVNRSAFAS